MELHMAPGQQAGSESQPSSDSQKPKPVKPKARNGKSLPKLARPEGPYPPCPRCEAASENIKFAYYNNRNLNQPRYYCKACQRHWTAGGALRKVEEGAGRRRPVRKADACQVHLPPEPITTRSNCRLNTESSAATTTTTPDHDGMATLWGTSTGHASGHTKFAAAGGQHVAQRANGLQRSSVQGPSAPLQSNLNRSASAHNLSGALDPDPLAISSEEDAVLADFADLLADDDGAPEWPDMDDNMWRGAVQAAINAPVGSRTVQNAGPHHALPVDAAQGGYPGGVPADITAASNSSRSNPSTTHTGSTTPAHVSHSGNEISATMHHKMNTLAIDGQTSQPPHQQHAANYMAAPEQSRAYGQVAAYAPASAYAPDAEALLACRAAPPQRLPGLSAAHSLRAPIGRPSAEQMPPPPPQAPKPPHAQPVWDAMIRPQHQQHQRAHSGPINPKADPLAASAVKPETNLPRPDGGRSEERPRSPPPADADSSMRMTGSTSSKPSTGSAAMNTKSTSIGDEPAPPGTAQEAAPSRRYQKFCSRLVTPTPEGAETDPLAEHMTMHPEADLSASADAKAADVDGKNQGAQGAKWSSEYLRGSEEGTRDAQHEQLREAVLQHQEEQRWRGDKDWRDSAQANTPEVQDARMARLPVALPSSGFAAPGAADTAAADASHGRASLGMPPMMADLPSPYQGDALPMRDGMPPTHARSQDCPARSPMASGSLTPSRHTTGGMQQTHDRQMQLAPMRAHAGWQPQGAIAPGGGGGGGGGAAFVPGRNQSGSTSRTPSTWEGRVSSQSDVQSIASTRAPQAVLGSAQQSRTLSGSQAGLAPAFHASWGVPQHQQAQQQAQPQPQYLQPPPQQQRQQHLPPQSQAQHRTSDPVYEGQKWPPALHVPWQQAPSPPAQMQAPQHMYGGQVYQQPQSQQQLQQQPQANYHDPAHHMRPQAEQAHGQRGFEWVSAPAQSDRDYNGPSAAALLGFADVQHQHAAQQQPSQQPPPPPQPQQQPAWLQGARGWLPGDGAPPFASVPQKQQGGDGNVQQAQHMHYSSADMLQ